MWTYAAALHGVNQGELNICIAFYVYNSENFKYWNFPPFSNIIHFWCRFFSMLREANIPTVAAEVLSDALQNVALELLPHKDTPLRNYISRHATFSSGGEEWALSVISVARWLLGTSGWLYPRTRGGWWDSSLQHIVTMVSLGPVLRGFFHCSARDRSAFSVGILGHFGGRGDGRFQNCSQRTRLGGEC